MNDIMNIIRAEQARERTRSLVGDLMRARTLSVAEALFEVQSLNVLGILRNLDVPTTRVITRVPIARGLFVTTRPEYVGQGWFMVAEEVTKDQQTLSHPFVLTVNRTVLQIETPRNGDRYYTELQSTFVTPWPARHESAWPCMFDVVDQVRMLIDE